MELRETEAALEREIQELRAKLGSARDDAKSRGGRQRRCPAVFHRRLPGAVGRSIGGGRRQRYDGEPCRGSAAPLPSADVQCRFQRFRHGIGGFLGWFSGGTTAFAPSQAPTVPTLLLLLLLFCSFFSF